MKGRSIAAVFAGIIAGAIITYFLTPIVDQIYPPDKELLKVIIHDRNAFADYIRGLPAGFHLFGIAIGALRLIVGLIIGGLIDKENLMTLIIIGAFSLLLAILDVFVVPHPIWFGILYIPVLIGITAGFIYLKRKA